MDPKEVAMNYAKVNPPPPLIRIEKQCFAREKTETSHPFYDGMNTCESKIKFFGIYKKFQEERQFNRCMEMIGRSQDKSRTSESPLSTESRCYKFDSNNLDPRQDDFNKSADWLSTRIQCVPVVLSDCYKFWFESSESENRLSNSELKSRKRWKSRTVFEEWQMKIMQDYFLNVNSLPRNSEVDELCSRTNLDKKVIRVSIFRIQK